MKELTSLQIENFKNSLIKLKNDLIEKLKKNNRIEKADRDYYEYEKNKFYGIKDVRNLFDQNDENCEEIGSLFNEMDQNGLEYKEIDKLMSIQSRKENCKYVNFIHRRIEKEEFIEYKVNFCDVNHEYEHKKEVDYAKNRPCLIDCGYMIGEIVEIIKEKKVDYEYIVIEGKKVECCKGEYQKMATKNNLEYEEIKKLMLVITKKRLK